MTSYQGGVPYQATGTFEEQSQNIASNIKKISQNVSSMSKMVNQLQTPQDSQELRVQLHQIQNYTKTLAKDTSSMLMTLMKAPMDQPAQRLGRDRLSDEYMAALNCFQDTQKLAALKTKEDVNKVKAQNINIGDPFANSNKTGAGGAASRQAQMQATAQAEALAALEQREQDYRQLESDIVDVNTIFKELGTMIHEQGAAVDSIESHVEYSAHAVAEGAQQLTLAHSHKNKLRKKKVYIGIAVIIIVSILLIIIFNR